MSSFTPPGLPGLMAASAIRPAPTRPISSSRSTWPGRRRGSARRFVYFSTDYVFDGRDGPYAEDAPTSALSVYGQAKRDAELALASELGSKQLTVRTSWVFGPERQGKNFAYQLLRNLAAGKPTVYSV